MKIRIKIPDDRIVAIELGDDLTIDFPKKPDPKEVTRRAIEYLDELFKPYLNEGQKQCD